MWKKSDRKWQTSVKKSWNCKFKWLQHSVNKSRKCKKIDKKSQTSEKSDKHVKKCDKKWQISEKEKVTKCNKQVKKSVKRSQTSGNKTQKCKFKWQKITSWQKTT